MAAGPVAKQTASVMQSPACFPKRCCIQRATRRWSTHDLFGKGEYTIEIVSNETFFLRIVQTARFPL